MKTISFIKMLSLFGLLLAGLYGCISIKNPHSKLPPGQWRAVLLPDKLMSVNERIPDKDIVAGKVKFEAVAVGEIPFNFEVIYETEEDFYIVIRNAEERIEIRDITYGLDRSTAKDTLTIEFPIYNTKIMAIYEESVIEGFWIDMNKENYRIPFVAFHGQDHRFTQLRKAPEADLSGTWEVVFVNQEGQATPAIGEFKQLNNDISGTFLLETGDLRYLEGTVQGNKMYLSSFDGSVAYLFEAKLMEDGSLQGIFRSGRHHRSTWEGRRNDAIALQDPKLLSLASGLPVSFTFPDQDGVPYTWSTDEQKGSILQIMGTWCRNCYDESLFMKEMLEKYGSDQLRIISLAFERANSEADGLAKIRRYRERLQLPYPVLLAGTSTKKEDASTALPFLSSVNAFPSTVFIDGQGKIKAIYTGIYGPASERYEAYKADIEEAIKSILPQ